MNLFPDELYMMIPHILIYIFGFGMSSIIERKYFKKTSSRIIYYIFVALLGILILKVSSN